MSSASDQNKIENEEIYFFKLEFISCETLEIRMNSDEIREYYDTTFSNFMKIKLTNLLNLDPDSEPTVKVINKINQNDISSLIVNDSNLNLLDFYVDNNYDNNYDNMDDDNYYMDDNDNMDDHHHHFNFIVMIGYDDKIYDITGHALRSDVTDVVGNVDKMNRLKRENGNVDFPSSQEFIRRVIQDPEFRHEMYGTKKVVLPIVFRTSTEAVSRALPIRLERINFLTNITKYQQIWAYGSGIETETGTGTSNHISRSEFVKRYTQFGRGSEEKAHKKYNLFTKQFL
jgi:hypothetical protein